MFNRAPIRWFPRLLSGAALAMRRFDPADFSPAIKTRLLILQPTPFCNINCDYCYLPNRNSKARMKVATVQRAAERLRDDGLIGPGLTVVWHAGEPLTVSPAFYEEAIAAIRESVPSSCAVSHSIQTNAILVDDEWCNLFRRHSIRVGVSVDGPAELHDAHRRTRTRRGTHAKALRGMAKLREHGIDFHAIAVVTAATFARADAFFDFFAEQGVTDVGCNYDEAEGLHQRSSLVGHETEHATFLARMLERSIADGRLRVRELAMARRLIEEPLPRYRWNNLEWPDNAQTLPFALIAVAHSGDFSTFSPELLGQPSAEHGDFILGNVHFKGYFDSARDVRFERLWSAIELGVRECASSCAYYGFCGGGSPVNKLYENNHLSSTETLYCRSMIKRPFDTVLVRLEREADKRRKTVETNA